LPAQQASAGSPPESQDISAAENHPLHVWASQHNSNSLKNNHHKPANNALKPQATKDAKTKRNKYLPRLEESSPKPDKNQMRANKNRDLRSYFICVNLI
jgi:hypothetical protein